MSVEPKRHRSRSIEPASSQISGVKFINPHQQEGESTVECEHRVCEAVAEAVRYHYHSGDQHKIKIAHCSIGSPREGRNSVAYIEFVYGFDGRQGGWRCGFSVSHSAANGYRLWNVVRNFARRV